MHEFMMQSVYIIHNTQMLLNNKQSKLNKKKKWYEKKKTGGMKKLKKIQCNKTQVESLKQNECKK